MEIKYFENGFVGKAVYDTNEAIKCFNAGMDVSSEIGDFLYENMEGNLPNDSEVITRIIESIQENGKVYVGFYLEGKKVVDINTTTLTCDFKIGQSVYFLDNGKICTSTIKEISLTAGSSPPRARKSCCRQATRLSCLTPREWDCARSSGW